MSLCDGFFDAVMDDETQEYDRAYTSGDFTGYFANVIGSGVCVHDNPDSFKAEYEDGTLYLRPGYLFIQGYWLANKAGEEESNYKGYAVTLPAGMTGSMAVVAHLNLGQRLIEIGVQPVSQAYPDSLVLAIITTTTAEDTRHNTDICGVIDTAGELSAQVEWAVNYIDTEIDSKLQQVEQDIAAQDAKLDAKIAEVQAVADNIVPPPVGSIKFSASQDAGEEWLKCDGSFINEADYPELVAALGKLTPSADKFNLISSGEIGPQISNGVIYGGRLWVYSYSTKKLYGVDVAGTAAVKEITLSSEDTNFQNFIGPSVSQPIALSVAGGMLFLAQILSSGLLIFCASFTGNESELSVKKPFNMIGESDTYKHDFKNCVPYVVSNVESSEAWFYCMISGYGRNEKFAYIKWKNGDDAATYVYADSGSNTYKTQRIAFHKKSRNEAVIIDHEYGEGSVTKTSILSTPNNTFKRDAISGVVTDILSVPNALNIIGQDMVLFEMSKTAVLVVSLSSLKAPKKVEIKNINLPTVARVFVDGGAYLWGKDIYMIFVGTGILFSRTLEAGSFGYLDTTSVLGTITQFGYLDYSEDEGTLYLLGQDTTNTVKVARMELNTLYDYANDGAWLPMIASDGVPAYIKAIDDTPSGQTVPMTVTVKNDYISEASVFFNGEQLISGTYTRDVAENGKFAVRIKDEDGNRYAHYLSINGVVAIASGSGDRTKEFNVNDYISSGVALTVGR